MLIHTLSDITVLKIVAANRLRNFPSDTAIHRRCRNRWAIALKLAGKTHYIANGKTLCTDSLHPVILPKGSSYHWRCTEPGECLFIEFDAPQTCDDIFCATLSDNQFFIHDFARIEKSLQTDTPEARLEGIRSLYDLLLRLVKTTAKEYAPKEKQQLLQPAVNYISANYYIPDITNDHLAQLCGISTVYFRQCFEAVYGVSPIRYLHNYRTQKAKDILSSDYGSISQIAESTGYRSVYHFSKMFKKYTGQSPTEYAKESR